MVTIRTYTTCISIIGIDKQVTLIDKADIPFLINLLRNVA